LRTSRARAAHTLLGQGLVPDPEQAAGPALELAALGWLQAKLETKGLDTGHAYNLRAVCELGKLQRGFAALRAVPSPG